MTVAPRFFLDLRGGGDLLDLEAAGRHAPQAQTHLGRSLPEIAALADTLYVSFYKGLGGLAGAALVGDADADVVEEARRWRRRIGGTTYRSTPETVAALVGLRDRLPLMGDRGHWARRLASALPTHVTPQPSVPHTGTFRMYAAGEPDVVNRWLLSFVNTDGLALTPPWSAAGEPGRVVCELAIGEDALGLDPREDRRAGRRAGGPARRPARRGGQSRSTTRVTSYVVAGVGGVLNRALGR